MSTTENFESFKRFHLQHPENGWIEIMFSPSADENLPSEKHRFTINDLFEFLEVAVKNLEHTDVTGLIYRLGNTQANGELDYKKVLSEAKSVDEFRAFLTRLNTMRVKIRRLGKPLISIIEGDFKGTLFGWALMADYRIGVGKTTTVGFPESAYGIFPGYGAFNRMVDLWGIDFALRMANLPKNYSLAEAENLGLIDNQVSNLNEAYALAKKWKQNEVEIDQKTKADNRNALSSYHVNPIFPNVSATKSISKHIDKPLNERLSFESDQYLHVLRSETTFALLRTNYYGIRNIQSKLARLKKEQPNSIRKIGVVGAGMMGSGIAYEAARAKMNVVLLDVDLAQAEKGKQYSQRITDKQLAKSEITANQQHALLDRIQCTKSYEDLFDADLIVEAVFEDTELKSKVLSKVSVELHKNAVLATNTTSLPIESLASATQRSEKFLGMHFFSPVERMPLLEIIAGAETSEKTKVFALQIAHKLGKIPILVNDGPAFFTSRIFFHYSLEGITMLLEGISPEIVESAAKNAGFPVGPLLVLDEISLPLMLHVYDQLPQLHDTQRKAYQYLRSVIEQGRLGRKANAGLYDYDEQGKRIALWKDVRLTPSESVHDESDLQARLLHIVALDSFRCLDEGVLLNTLDGDIGSILGIGYAPHTGGVFSHIDQVGLPNFLSDCQRFLKHGEQWNVPRRLVELANQNFKFYTDFQSNWKTDVE